jgi:IS5 family transposase
MAGAGRGSAAVLPERRWPRPSADAPGAHLRMYIAQQCFGLSDEGIEDAIYDSQSIRGFVGIDLTHESAPDATTLLKFRRLLEKHNLTRRIFDEINVFKHRKTRYRGLEKNNAQLFTLFGFANLILARWFLGSAHAQVVS